MALIDRLRTAVGAPPDSGVEASLREAASLPARERPPMDLVVPDRLETATFALG